MEINFKLFLLGTAHNRPQPKETPRGYTEFNFDGVCTKGNTLLWDLVQEDTAVSYYGRALY